MDPSVVKTLLKRNPLFEPMSEMSLDYLVSNGWLRDYPTGTRLILQGSSNHALFAILGGKVSVTRRENSGSRVRVAELKAGAAVGEISAIYDRPSTADVVATEPVRGLVIHK